MVDNAKNKHPSPTENGSHREINTNTSNKKCKKYFMMESNIKIYFNADFDSGNL